jgi:hypothetical protein
VALVAGVSFLWRSQPRWRLQKVISPIVSPGVADQRDDALVNPCDFIAFDACTPAGSTLCAPLNVSSVLVASKGSGTVVQYTPIRTSSSCFLLNRAMASILPAVNKTI